jgi:4-hydroxybenzoate polyprenyltransferase
MTMGFIGSPTFYQQKQMGKVLIYLRLFRWPNLLVLALAQCLFRFAVILPASGVHGPGMSHFLFALLVVSTAGIAAAGYAINDYFDLRIDRINKPGRIILGRMLGRRNAIVAHQLLNAVSVFLGLYVAMRLDSWAVALVFLCCPALLWLYSIRLKRQLLSGNLAVALLSAISVGLVWLAEYQGMARIAELPRALLGEMSRMALFYGLLAFLLTLIREVLKDMEDRKGDSCAGCRTLPVVLGLKGAKISVTSLLLLLILCLAVFQADFMETGNRVMVFFLAGLVQLPALAIVPALWREERAEGFGRLQKVVKGIMAAGVLSMLLYQPMVQWALTG